MPGIGHILALVILYEIERIKRFARVQDFFLLPLQVFVVWSPAVSRCWRTPSTTIWAVIQRATKDHLTAQKTALGDRDAGAYAAVGMTMTITVVVLSRHNCSDFSQASIEPGNTGLMSTTGVPSSASRGSTRKRTDSAISNTRTRCSPMGFGRSGERVAKTPFRGSRDRLGGEPARRPDALDRATSIESPPVQRRYIAVSWERTKPIGRSE
jgi:hypothetical protein